MRSTRTGRYERCHVSHWWECLVIELVDLQNDELVGSPFSHLSSSRIGRKQARLERSLSDQVHFEVEIPSAYAPHPSYKTYKRAHCLIRSHQSLSHPKSNDVIDPGLTRPQAASIAFSSPSTDLLGKRHTHSNCSKYGDGSRRCRLLRRSGWRSCRLEMPCAIQSGNLGRFSVRRVRHPGRPWKMKMTYLFIPFASVHIGGQQWLKALW